MGVGRAIDISIEQRETILTLLERHLPGTVAWVYGSRAKWTSRPQSDLDLVVFAAPEQRSQVAALRDAFEESDLPFRVDLFVWGEVPKSFHEKIEAEHVELTPKPTVVADRLHLQPKHRQVLEGLLRTHLSGVEVWAYGSRVSGKSHAGSALDLVLRGPGLTEIALAQLGDFEEAVRDSTIPFLVEVRDWARIPRQFQREIERDHLVLVSSKLDSRATTDAATEPLRSRRDWKAREIGDCALMVRNVVSPHEVGEIPYIGLEHIERNGLRLLGHGLASDAVSLKKRFRKGDILFGKLRPYFRKVVRVPFDGVCSTDIWVLRPAKGVNALFLLYLMASQPVIDEASRGSEGTKMPRAQWSFLSRMCRFIPPLQEQCAIAHILGTLDDKIELNRRMNETLEAMVRALFKSWFVDFDPVRARMEGRGPGLLRPFADLFPDRLVDSEIGEIPEGWEVSRIGDEVKAVGGATPNTQNPIYWTDGTHNWATPKDLSNLSSPVLLKTNRKITDAGVKKISSGLLPIGTVLLSSRAPIGYLAIAEVQTAVNQGFIAMVCKRRLPNIFVLFWCYENLDYIKGISGGSTFAEISKKVFRPVPVVVPPEQVSAAYESLVRPLYNRIITNTKESASLAQIRDFLLPKLISGYIRLRGAEEAIEAVT